MGDRLIFQLGTNNWQRGGEFAPGSGILHEAHHRAYNALPGVRCYSMYPSRRQRFKDEDVHVFALDHDIPICESVSPGRSYRWHAMSEDEVDAYRGRLTDEVADWMDEIEASTGDRFGLAIAHHAFMNTVVMRDVIRRGAWRPGEARDAAAVLRARHRAEDVRERAARRQPGRVPDALPAVHAAGEDLRLRRSRARRRRGRVDLRTSRSTRWSTCSPSSRASGWCSPTTATTQDVFHAGGDAYADRAAVLAGFSTQPLEGSGRAPEPVAPADGFDAVVAFVGKFADWKRLDALLRAAAIYEQHPTRKILTLVAGSGPLEAQVKMHDLVAELGLTRTYLVGPRPQDELATLFSVADVGCFPSYREPFGLVFIECMACGTPVIGADSGGPRDFVTDEVGTLVPETDDRAELAASLAATITRAVDEDWKATKGPVAEAYSRERFSVVGQVSELLAEVERLTAG